MIPFTRTVPLNNRERYTFAVASRYRQNQGVVIVAGRLIFKGAHRNPFEGFGKLSWIKIASKIRLFRIKNGGEVELG